MKFYWPSRYQAAARIGTYFALLETIKRYQNEEIEPLGGEQRSRRVALQVLGMFSAWGSKCGSGSCLTFWPTPKSAFLQQKSTENRSFRCFLSCVDKKDTFAKHCATRLCGISMKIFQKSKSDFRTPDQWLKGMTYFFICIITGNAFLVNGSY